MIARATQNTLRSKLLHSGVVLLRALPRAGRTSLLSALAAEMDDGSAVMSGEQLACMSHQEIQTAFSGKVLCVDAIDGAQVPRVESIIRSCTEHQRSAPRFILAARNTKTDQKLSSALIGIITNLELTPIQVMEHLNDSKPLMTTQGPSSTIIPYSSASSAVKRMPTIKSRPTRSRMACNTSTENCMRLFSDCGPYRPSISLVSGDQN